jgi:hypothetical protein
MENAKMNNMKTKIYTAISMLGAAIITLLGPISCKNADFQVFDRDANVYLNLEGINRDSITYTFAYDISKSSDTIFIPVRVMGFRSPQARQFSAYVERDSSSAIAGVHYEALAASYTMPADSGHTFLPLVIYNVPELEEKSVSVIVKLRESEDFGIENPKIIRAKVVFSARLEQPIWWNMWLGGYYSRTKHQLFLIATEQTEMTMDGLDAPRNLYYVNLLTMMLNSPFNWVADNAEKGYVLKSRVSDEVYDFFHQDNPARSIELRKNQASGRYFFIDENGIEVN